MDQVLGKRLCLVLQFFDLLTLVFVNRLRPVLLLDRGALLRLKCFQMQIGKKPGPVELTIRTWFSREYFLLVSAQRHRLIKASLRAVV